MFLLCILLLIILMFYTYKARWNPARPDFYPLEEIIIVGHRGAPVLAPGNTIESFKKAFETGIKGIELDIQLSKAFLNDSIVFPGASTGAPRCPTIIISSKG
jgi:hypothetical protein